MPPCVTSHCATKLRSETTQSFKPKHSSHLWASLYVPWTTPGASQVFQARVREASLSTADSSPQPASPFLWKVSPNHRGGGGGIAGGRGGGRGDSGVGGEGSD